MDDVHGQLQQGVDAVARSRHSQAVGGFKRIRGHPIGRLKKRLDRVDDRVLFLEQSRQASADADRGADIALLDVHEREPH